MYETGSHWRDRAPPELLVPHDHAVAAVESLDGLSLGPEPVMGIAYYTMPFAQQEWIEAVGASSWPTEESLICSVACALAHLRDAVFQGNAALERVEERFAAASPGVVRGAYLSESSLHRYAMSAASEALNMLLEAFDFDKALASDEQYAERVEQFTKEDIRKYITLGRLKDLKPDMVTGLLPYDPDQMQAELQWEFFRAWGQAFEDDRETPDPEDDPPTADTIGLVTARGRLTEMEQQIMSIIREVGHRLTTDEIMDILRQRNGAASLGTTKQTLAHLTRWNLLTNRQRGLHKGYGLPEWP